MLFRLFTEYWFSELFWSKFKTIHGFTISVLIFILPDFRQLLIRTENFKKIFVLKQANTACRQQMTTAKLPHKHLKKLSIVHFQIGVVFQLKYYQQPNQVPLRNKERNFLQIRYGFYRHALKIHYQLWWLVIERACTKNSRKLISWFFNLKKLVSI